MRKKVFSYVFLCYVLLLSTLCFADSATDPLATSVRPQVGCSFGIGFDGGVLYLYCGDCVG